MTSTEAIFSWNPGFANGANLKCSLLPPLVPYSWPPTAEHCPPCGHLLLAEQGMWLSPANPGLLARLEITLPKISNFYHQPVLISGVFPQATAVVSPRRPWWRRGARGFCGAEMVKWRWKLREVALTPEPSSHKAAAADMSIEMPAKGLWEEKKPSGPTVQHII